MKRKLIIALAMALVAVSLCVPLANAQTLAVSNAIGNYDEDLAIAANTFWGYTFTGTDAYLYAVTFYFKNTTASVSGTVNAKLFNATTTKPANGAPVEATSTNSFNLLNCDGVETFNFTFDATYYLASTQVYTIVFCMSPTVTQNIKLYGDTTGTCAYTTNGGTSWLNSATTHEPIFYLYTTDLEGGGEEGETDPGSWTYTGTYDDLINGLMGFLVPLLVILLPTAILCAATRRIDKWLVLIGLTIGTGLGYVIMPTVVPIWLVFLVVIGLIGMAYQSVRGGG